MENTKPEKKGPFTCLITIVQPGLPDSVIKVHPADHEVEKIWLDRNPGRERWAAVKQLMQRYCPRGKYVPEPAYIHPPTGKQEDLAVILTKPEDYPYIELDGAVLSAPPADDRFSRPRPDSLAKEGVAKVEKLQEQVNTLTTQVATLVQALTVSPNNAAPRKPGRPKKEATP